MKAFKLFLFVAALVVANLIPSYKSFAEDPAKASIIELSGQVRFKNPGDTDWKSATKETELIQGAQLFVGENSECRLMLGSDSKSVTKIKQETRVVLTSLGDDARIDVTSGEIFSLFKRLDNAQSTFKVVSPTAVAAVRGTAFSFAAEGIGSEVSNTLEVYENTVGLSPLNAPDKEIAVGEGQGVVMGADGVVEKQFELSAENMRVAQEFIQQAAEALPLDRPAPENISPPAGGPADGPGGTSGQVDSAMDGVVMGMAHDSELSRSQAFSGATLDHDVSNLSDLNFGSNPAAGNIDPGLLADTVKTAVMQSDYFQSQPPEVQQQITAHMDTYFEKYAANFQGGPPTDVAGGFQGGPGEAPAGMDAGAFNTGTYGQLGAGGDPFFNSPEGYMSGLISPEDLASVINEHNFKPSPQELQSIINFIIKIQQDYNAYVTANGNDVGYYGSPRTVQNFAFIKDNVNYTGSIVFTPVAVVDPNPSAGAHSHGGIDLLHLTDVDIKDSPTGVGGNVVANPSGAGTLEVPTV